MPESLSSPVHEAPAFPSARVPSCAVLVMSCDAYRDLWLPFFTLFWQYWPDCPFSVYLGSNHAPYHDSRVTTLAVGDHEWSRRLRLCLEGIDTQYVLLLLEDYFLNQRISTPAILENLHSLDSLAGTVLRLHPRPAPDVPLSRHAGISRIHRLAPYRISTQPAIWNRTALLTLLADEESIWDFEWQGTLRSQTFPDSFYGTQQTVFPYRHVVERGQWFWNAARHFASRQIGCDFDARATMGPAKAFSKALHRLFKNSMYAILPIRFRRLIT